MLDKTTQHSLCLAFLFLSLERGDQLCGVPILALENFLCHRLGGGFDNFLEQNALLGLHHILHFESHKESSIRSLLIALLLLSVWQQRDFVCSLSLVPGWKFSFVFQSGTTKHFLGVRIL